MLTLFSGGVESTALIKWWLTTQTEPLTVAHIHCPNSVGRAHLELAAVHRLLPRLEEFGTFTYHRVDISFPFDVRDSEVQLSVLPALMRHTGERQFIKGLCLEDWHDGAGYRGPEMNQHTARARFGRRMAELVKGYFEYDKNGYPTPTDTFKYKTWQEVSPFYEPMLWPKAKHIEYLGSLYPLTFSCLRPIFGKPCGECGTCKLRDENPAK